MKLETAAGLYSQQYEARSASPTTDDLANPYVGPRPFETAHRKLFFGRDLEADTLLSITIAERVVLFHAQSGAGKSSLVNAKVIPGLEEQDYLVLPRARVGLGDGGKQKGVANVFVFNALSSIAPREIGIEALKQAQLSQYRAWLLPEQQDTPRWLIFDQFEEILTTHKDFWQQRDDFFRQVAAALSQDSLLSVMFVMRSDQGAGIEPYTGLLPDGLRTRFYMELPKRAAALDAVQKPVLEFGCVFEKDAAEELVKRLSRINPDGETVDQYVEPVLLQVVCRQLWNSIAATDERPATNITIADVKNHARVDEALRHFYEEAVTEVSMGRSNTEAQIRDWFGQRLIVPPGIREQVVRGAQESGGLETALADQFVEKHIIRSEVTRDRTRYELAHDRLIAPIKESNDAWLNLKENVYHRLALKWHEADSPDDLLLAAQELPAAQDWLQHNGEVASPRVKEYIKTSSEKEDRRRDKQRMLETDRANEVLLAQKKDLEAQQDEILKSTKAKIEYLRAKARRRKIISFIILGVAVVGIIGTIIYAYRIKRNLQTFRAEQEHELNIKTSELRAESAKFQQENAAKRAQLNLLYNVYHLDPASATRTLDTAQAADEQALNIQEQHQKRRIPVGIPQTLLEDQGLTQFILSTPLVQLREVPKRTTGRDPAADSSAEEASGPPPKIIFWNRDACGPGCEWQPQYIAYVLMRAGVQVKMIRECGNSPEEAANVSGPAAQRDFNLCLWNGEDWKGMSVVVGWSKRIPLKDNCELTVAQVADKNAWRICLDQ